MNSVNNSTWHLQHHVVSPCLQLSSCQLIPVVISGRWCLWAGVQSHLEKAMAHRTSIDTFRYQCPKTAWHDMSIFFRKEWIGRTSYLSTRPDHQRTSVKIAQVVLNMVCLTVSWHLGCYLFYAHPCAMHFFQANPDVACTNSPEIKDNQDKQIYTRTHINQAWSNVSLVPFGKYRAWKTWPAWRTSSWPYIRLLTWETSWWPLMKPCDTWQSFGSCCCHPYRLAAMISHSFRAALSDHPSSVWSFSVKSMIQWEWWYERNFPTAYMNIIEYNMIITTMYKYYINNSKSISAHNVNNMCEWNDNVIAGCHADLIALLVVLLLSSCLISSYSIYHRHLRDNTVLGVQYDSPVLMVNHDEWKGKWEHDSHNID